MKGYYGNNPAGRAEENKANSKPIASDRVFVSFGKWINTAELKKYVSGLYPKQEKIFWDSFNRYRWGKIREKVGLSDFKFHDLRKTFGSVLAQNGVWYAPKNWSGSYERITGKAG